MRPLHPIIVKVIIFPSRGPRRHLRHCVDCVACVVALHDHVHAVRARKHAFANVCVACVCRRRLRRTPRTFASKAASAGAVLVGCSRLGSARASLSRIIRGVGAASLPSSSRIRGPTLTWRHMHYFRVPVSNHECTGTPSSLVVLTHPGV